MPETRDLDPGQHSGYWAASRRPLHILIFLLPLIIGYEIGLAIVLPASDGLHVNTVEAHRGLLRFFGLFGIAPGGGLLLGGVVIVVVLLCWHVLARERWQVDLGVVGGMAAETALLTAPLLVLGRLVAQGAATATGGPALVELDLGSQMAISVGAGLYEELLFRMVLLAALHTLLVDVARLPEWPGTAVAILASAAAFTWYHDLGQGDVVGPRVLFYGLAGVYFGVVYVLRGFGIVVAVHALYDVVTVLLLRSAEA